MGLLRATRRSLLKPHTTAGGTHPLYTSLVAYWKLDEASGNRADSVGTATLTDNNTVTSEAGLVYPSAARFTATNNEYLTGAIGTGVTLGDIDFAIGIWLYAVTGGVRVFFSKYDAAGWQFLINGAYIQWQIGAGIKNVTAGALSTGAWVYALAAFAASTNTSSLYLNNVLAESKVSDVPSETDGTLNIGRQGANGYYWDGRLGPIAFWKNYIPTPVDRTWLYNAGAGRTLAAIQAYTP